jgi:2-acylglycerol O-acyltransferase 2
MSKDHKQSLFSYCVALLTMTLFTGWISIFLAIAIGAFFSHTCAVLFWLLMATLLLPAKPLLWTPFMKHWVFRTWREYFHFSCLQEEASDPQKKYVYIHFPHGVIPMSEVVGGTLRPYVWPDSKLYGLAADSVFYIPLWRHFYAFMGLVPASVENFKRVLSQGNLAVIVGGIAGRWVNGRCSAG